MRVLLFCTVFIILAISQSANGDTQRVGVFGQLNCKGKPFKGATVKIVDKNVGPDTGMDEKTTDTNGTFSLDGSSSSMMSKIDPYLKIYHTCGSSLLSCKRRWVFKFPKDQIYSKNDKKFKAMDFGIAELTFIPNEEDSKCMPLG